MKKSIRQISLAVTAVCATLLALPAQAVQVSFSGSGGTQASIVNGIDDLKNTWSITNGPAGTNSRFTMADSAETPQAFNRADFSNGLGTFANSFQLTINRSQQGSGFMGILLTPASTGQSNEFQVQDDDKNWYSWVMSYDLTAKNGYFQQILFTAPTGKQLSKGQDFKMNVNFAGIITTDTGFAASWDDRAAPAVALEVPEPGSMALMGLGMLGLVGVSRRKKGSAAQQA